MACGDAHTIVLDTQGTAHSWGCNGNGRLGKDGLRRHDNVEFVGTEFIGGKIGFVFPGKQHVAKFTLGKGRGRSACALADS